MDATPHPVRANRVITAPPALTCFGWGGLRVLAPAIPAGTGGPSCCLDLHLRRKTVNGVSAWLTPKLAGETRAGPAPWLERPPCEPGRPRATAIVTDKGLSRPGHRSGSSPGPDLGPDPDPPPGPPRREGPPGTSRTGCGKRAEAIIWTLKNQLGLERHGRPAVPRRGCGPAFVQRLLALNNRPSGTTGKSAAPGQAPR